MQPTITNQAEALRAEVRQLGAGLLGGDLSLLQFRTDLCKLLQQGFECSRASLWRFTGEAGELKLRCVGVYCEARGFEESRAELHEHEYGTYFAELLKRGVYSSSDVMADANLHELVASYFEPAGVRSLLDAAFQVNGRAFGVLCLEQIGKLREWTTAEQALVRQIASLISLSVARLPAGFEFILPE